MLPEVDGSSGQVSQSSRIIYYGISESRKLQKATIYWTNGRKSVIRNLRGNRIYEYSSSGKLTKIRLKGKRNYDICL